MKKVAFVTGSRRGIGLATAKKLSLLGYSVVISGVTPKDAARESLQVFQGTYDFNYYRCDISQAEDRASAFSYIDQKFGRLDLLVNNAGVAPKVRADLLETSEQNIRWLLDTNLFGTFFMCQSGAKLMIEMQSRGIEDYHPRIVNISSISAYTSSVNRSEYCISKAGVSMITQLFADRLASEGIPVFEIRPGIIQTDMTAGVKDMYQKKIDEGITPIKRFGQPEDVANCVAALASGLLDFSTGQVLNADGGFHIRRL